MNETDIRNLPVKILNQRLDHIEVSEKKFLMKERRKLKNICSSQKTRQKAEHHRQSKESEISLLKSSLKATGETLAREKEIRLEAQKQNQVFIKYICNV